MLPEEFKSSVYPFKNRLFRFARWMIMDDLQAEDFVQDVFVKLWNMRHELSKYQSLEALAMRMIKNLCLNEKKKLRRFVSEPSEQDAIESSPGPLEKMVNADKKTLIEHILGTLSQQQRMVVQLRDIEGYEMEEIAAITELTENNLWVILSRARKNIREAYLKFEQNEQSRDRRSAE